MFDRIPTRLAAAAAVMVGLASPALAEDYTKDHLAAAKAAIEASHVNEGFDNLLIGVTQQTKQMLGRTNPALSSQIDEVANLVALQLAAKRPELDYQVQEIWAARFSKAELEEITKFYSSPVGVKLTKETSGMVRMTGVAAQVWQQKIGQEMVEKIREEMKKRGNAL